METARTTWTPWRSWVAIALVLVTLALVQACGESGRHTGPTTTSGLQLKIRRVGGAELPAGCTGTYSVTGPGVNTQNAALPADGHISFQGQLGQQYTISVQLSCPGLGALGGEASVTVPPGGTKTEIVINVSKVLGVACSPSTVGPGESSTCRCDVQSPGPSSITWTGVSSFSGATASFSNQNPGNYAVSCTINGIDTRSTTVTVKAPEATPPPPPPPPQATTIQIFNNEFLQLRRKGLAEHQGGEPVFTRIVEIARSVRTIFRGHNVTIPVAPGTYTVEGSCNAGFDGTFPGTPPTVTVNPGGNAVVTFNDPCID
jgi:hypothetical protein